MRKQYEEKQDLLRTYARLPKITKKEFKQLIILSRDKEPMVRVDVATILFDVKNAAAKKVLLQLACDKVALVRTEAYDSLSGFAFPEIEIFLKKAVKTERDALARTYAISSWTEVAIALFEDHSDDISFIKWMLEKTKIKKSEHCLLECYYALYRFGEKEMLAKILSFFRSKDYRIRLAVFHVLEEIVDDENRDKIIDAIENMLIEETAVGVKKTVIPFWKRLILEQAMATVEEER